MSQPPWEVNNHFNNQEGSGGQVKLYDPNAGPPAEGVQQQQHHAQPQTYDPGYNNMSNGNPAGHSENAPTQGSEGWDDAWNYSWENPQGENRSFPEEQPHDQYGAQPGVAQDWNQGQQHEQQWQPRDQYMPPQGVYEQPPQNHAYEPHQYGNAIPMFHPEGSQQLQQPQQLPLQDIPLAEPFQSTEAASSGALSPPEAQPAAPQGSLIPASNSFNNLPHEPSPFDSLNPEHSGGAMLQAPVQAAATSQTHSRQSSYGNVQFIVGSENTSGTGTPEHSMNTSTQDLPYEPKLDVPTEPSSPEEPLTPVIEAQQPHFPEAQRRPPSVQSTRSIDSIGHEMRSQISSEPCSPLLASPPQHMSHVSPYGSGRQPSRQSQASASPGIRSLEGTASPMGSEPRPSPGTAGVNIFAQPIQPSPTSPFQPPHHQVQPPLFIEQPIPLPEQPPYPQEPPLYPQEQLPHPQEQPPYPQEQPQYPQDQPPVAIEQPPRPQEHPQPPPQHHPTSPDGPTPEDYKHSLSYQMHKHRHDQNMSPATTLWDNNPDLGNAPILSPFAEKTIPSQPAQFEAPPPPVQSMVSPSLPYASPPPPHPPTQAPVPPLPTNVAFPGAPSQTTPNRPPSRDDSRDSLSREFRPEERRHGDHREAERNPRGCDGREEMPERERQARRELPAAERDPRQSSHGDAPMYKTDEAVKADPRDGQYKDDPRDDQNRRSDRRRDSRDDRYKDPRDDRYKDPRDDRYKDSRDDQYKDPRDDRYKDPKDDRYKDPRDDRNRDREYFDRGGRRTDEGRGGHRDQRKDDRYRPPSRSSSVHGDDPYERPDRPHSRQGFDEYSDRPRSRQGYEEDWRHQRRSQQVEYDRPRSRQGSEYGDRPRSRQGFDDLDRPRSQQGFQDEDDYGRPRSQIGYEDPDSRRSRPTSRQGYPDDRRSDSRSRRSRPENEGRPRRESERDYYRQKEYYGQYGQQSSTGYPPNYYYGGYDYYQAGYYPPYQQPQDNYSKGYLEEMNSYVPGQPQVQPQAPAARSVEYLSGPSSSASSSRASSLMGSQTNLDQRSHHSGVISRGSTPGLSDTGADHFARDSVGGSRPSSRASAYEPQPAYPPPQPIQPAYQMQQPYAQYPPQAYYDPQTGYVYPGYEGQYGYDPNYQYPVKAEPEEPKRMTPAKFLMPHVCAKFGGASQLIQVAPNKPDEGEPALLNITELSQLLGQARVADNLKRFPGPLVKGQTHKAEVTAFCRMKADECRRNVDLRDRESAQLLWDYLALLVQQNGIVVGTDIAQLLLEGRSQETSSRRRLSSTRSNTASPPPPHAEEEGAQDRTVINRSSDVTAVNRFRELLLLGRKKDAIEWAMKSGLWGHALCLGSKMDAKTHASIMTRFATTALKMTDPLQTLFQLMSHRQPASVTLVADVKWDDWRPHLAMILSNPTSRSDVDTKSIVTLGDTLASRGCLFASHFCYLMAQQPFGHFSQKSAKLVLIGSSHTLPLAEFATSTAIQCTEVYEYGRSLADPTFSLPAFHVLKYLYVVRLIDHGLTEEAFNYCEVLSQNIFLAPALYNAPLVNGLLHLSCRLKFYDPERIQSGEDASDPYWLSQLQRVAAAFQDGTLQPQALPSFTPTLQPGRTSTTASSEVGEIMAPYAAQEQQQQQQQQQPQQQLQQLPQQVQQQQGLNSHQAQWGQQQYDQQAAWDQYNQAQPQQLQAQTEQAAPEPSTAPQWHTTEQSQVNGSYLGYMPQQQQLQQEPTPEPIHIQPAPARREQSPPTVQEPSFNPQQDEVDYYKMASDPMRASPLSTPASSPRFAGLSPPPSSQTKNVFQFGVPPPPLPNRRPPRAETPLGSSPSKAPPTSSASLPPSTTRKEEAVKTGKKQNNKQQSQSGWLGSLFSFKSKNEMKLPDDKNPAIIWDEATQSWLNTDGSEDDKPVSKAPPPTDFELGGPPSGIGGPPPGPPSSQGTPAQAPMPTPPSGSNRFTRQKTRGARGQYVDVFGSSAAKTPDAPSSLFNVLPKSQSMPAKLFVPAARESENEEAAAALAAAEEPAAAQPPMYMPSGQLNSQTFQPSVPEEESLSRCSSRSSMSMEVQRYMHQNPSKPTAEQPPVNQQAQAPPPEQQAPPSSMPMMFNPAQFSQAGGGGGAAGRGGGGAPSNPMGPPNTRNSMRLGQRRAYPK